MVKVGTSDQGSEHEVECISLYPASEAFENRVRLAKLTGQIAISLSKEIVMKLLSKRDGVDAPSHSGIEICHTGFVENQFK